MFKEELSKENQISCLLQGSLWNVAKASVIFKCVRSYIHRDIQLKYT